MALLKDKVGLITGGGSGIGRATALIFAREGAKLVIADLNRKGGEETAAMIEKAGGQAINIECNVLKPGAAEDLVAQAVKRYGRLDCAFNNAGVAGDQARTADSTEECWDFVVGIDLKSVWLCMKYEIAQMLKQKSGAIVNTASIAGLGANPLGIAYSAAKHGVVGLTRTAAVEYAKIPIRINAVCPGVTETPMVEAGLARRPQMRAVFTKGHPMGRLGRPEEIGEAVAWLCSDAASFITGIPLPVDGGFTAI
ncbi:MAG TPA: SDR family oxidoreductase [Candidatus Binataceae bacterium]|nr:SDR family oxidoreductase [Candidatus Binataceae bacterium]